MHLSLPPITPKQRRIAKHLVQLSLELVEPIIADLPVHSVLELLSIPIGNSTQSHTSFTDLGPLAHIVITSPSWRHIFVDVDQTRRLLRAWQGLNCASWICTRKPHLKNIHNEHPLKMLHEPACYFDNGRELIEEMEYTLIRSVPGLKIEEKYRYQYGDEDYNLGPSEDGKINLSNIFVDAMYQHLPIELDVMLGSEYPRWKSDTVNEFRPERLPNHFKTQKWDLSMAIRLLSELSQAWQRLTAAWSDELESLAALYERFPTLLKCALGPQMCHTPTNLQHIPTNLRASAKKLAWRELGVPIRGHWKKMPFGAPKPPCHFRYPHHYLVPYNWCLRLFEIVMSEKNPDIPPRLQAEMEEANIGLETVYDHEGYYCFRPRFTRFRNDPRLMEFIIYKDCESALPTPAAEMEWLTSFLAVVEWMTSEYPDIAEELRGPVPRLSRARNGRGQKRMLLEPSDYTPLINTLPDQEIAQYLKNDSQLCTRPSLSNPPSLLAFYLPKFSSPRGRSIGKHMGPKGQLPAEVQQFMYETMIEKVKRYFQQRPDIGASLDGLALVYEVQKKGKEMSSRPETSWEQTAQEYINAMPNETPSRARSCYICRRYMTETNGNHEMFTSMCKPCGNFNLAGSSMSLPDKLNLKGKVALVTGGRINLGFHTALRLLRCGAKVIVSSRYPHDALVRYQEEPDSSDWLDDRLRIVGADFRTARDAFELARLVKAIIANWSADGGQTDLRLDILINNAAQTLTDSEEKETNAIRRESDLGGSLPDCAALPSRLSYYPRVKGGMPAMAFLEDGTGKHLISTSTGSSSDIAPTPEKSSWVQDLTETPYIDVITAQAVNAFVPLILIRELLPLLSRNDGVQQSYIINVSSREGIFEKSGNHSAKQGKHVHTNMSKAALNMITETEAGPAWHNHRVAMNTVDPGYMSAAPEMENMFGVVRPLGWEDGAGRVLWPVAMAEGHEKSVIWGRFLKHYGAVSAIATLG